MAHENDGHRARLRERMMNEGLAGFRDHEVLELLLFQYLPRKDTNKLAHNLLNKFGSFAGVINASPQQLMTVDGISEVTACNLGILKEVFRRYKQSEQGRPSLKGVGSIVMFAQQLVAESYTERLVVVYVDNATGYLYKDEFASDDTQFVNVDPKRIVAAAMRTGAAGVMLFHCHIKGECRPSQEDYRFTERMTFALASINVSLLEHIIFNDSGDYYSFFLNGDIDAIQQKYKKLN